MGMLSTLLSILALFFIWNYFLIVPTDDNEFVMTQDYIEIFGGPNATRTYLRTCMRVDLVINRTRISEFYTKLRKSLGVEERPGRFFATFNAHNSRMGC
jgi:hypothetical protein